MPHARADTPGVRVPAATRRVLHYRRVRVPRLPHAGPAWDLFLQRLREGLQRKLRAGERPCHEDTGHHARAGPASAAPDQAPELVRRRRAGRIVSRGAQTGRNPSPGAPPVGARSYFTVSGPAQSVVFLCWPQRLDTPGSRPESGDASCDYTAVTHRFQVSHATPVGNQARRGCRGVDFRGPANWPSGDQSTQTGDTGLESHHGRISAFGGVPVEGSTV